MKPTRVKWLLRAGPPVILAVGVVGYAAGTYEGPGRGTSPTEVLGQTLASSVCPTSPPSPPTFSVCGPALGTGPTIYPGAPAKSLPITFYNPNNVPISITKLEIKFTNTFPTTPGSTCTPSAFVIGNVRGDAVSSAVPDVTITFGSPSFTVPAAAGATQGQAVYPATLALINDGDQDACKSLALTMTYSAMGQSVLGPSCVVISTAGVAPYSGTYKGNYEVKNGATFWLSGGTVNGNVVVDPNGKFLATQGTVNGNIQSSGGPVDLEGTTVTGNVQPTNASLGIGQGTTVLGSVQPVGGSTFCSTGASSAPVTVGNNLQVQDLASTPNPVRICDTSVKGNLQYQGNAAPVVIGGSSGCLGNQVGGNLQIQSNTATVTIGGAQGATRYGNTVGGNLQVQNNTIGVGGTLIDNTAVGNCQLSGNNPGIYGSGNTAGKKHNTCITGPGGA